MAIEKILFPTKFRELSYNSLETLFPLKEAGLREIILCHIISREDVGYVPFGGYLKEEENKRRDEARIRFEDWQNSLSERGIDSRTIILVGDPVPKILHVAKDEKVDLIIVGRKKRADLEHPFTGSDSIEIITRSTMPTLVSKYHVQYEIDGETFTRVNDHIFHTPLLITDWSEQCKRAIQLLSTMRNVIEKVVVFHTIGEKALKKYDKDELEKLEEENKQKLSDNCAWIEESDLTCESHLGAGDITKEILRISRERSASMIITGTTRKDRLHEIFLGSISHEIAKKSELPTLLVP